MKKLESLMEELGFNKEAPEATIKAFVSHLIFAAQQTERQRSKAGPPSSFQTQTTEERTQVSGEQLCFDFSQKEKDNDLDEDLAG